jgi:penicillin-insensitive murein endopeptidase
MATGDPTRPDSQTSIPAVADGVNRDFGASNGVESARVPVGASVRVSIRQTLVPAIAVVAACTGPSLEPETAVARPPVASVDPRTDAEAAATERRAPEPLIDGLPLVPIPRTHPAVGRLRGRGSLSIGTTRDGFVMGCRSLPADAPLRMLEVHSRRGTGCATDDLVEALAKAARDVARAAPGSVMTVGNMSRTGGGDIPWSISHNSGRDADIGFFLLGPDGKPYVARDLVRLDRDGMGLDGEVPVRLDVRRTWLAVRSLLTNPAVEVQWLFVATPLKKAMLEHAKRREPPSALARAEEALVQPAHAKAHDDHIHLRIYCPPDDLLEGCQDRGTNRPWFVDRKARVDARVAELLPLLRARQPGTRAAAAAVLGRIGRSEHVPRLLAMLGDEVASVRLAAALAIAEAGPAGALPAVERAIRTAKDDAVAVALLQAVERGTAGEARAGSLARLLASQREFVADLGVFQARWTVARWSADALVRLGGARAVGELVDALGRPGVDEAAAVGALRELTASDPAMEPPPGVAPAAVAGAWRKWWARYRETDARAWYRQALLPTNGRQASGLGAPEAAGLMDLVRAIDWRWRGAVSLLRASAPAQAGRLPPDGIEPFTVLLDRILHQSTTASATLPAAENGTAIDTPD